MAKVFVNDEIFTSDSDYIIGGFETDKVQAFTYADFVASLRNRIEVLLQDFIDRTIVIETARGNENPKEKACNDIALIILDNLKQNPEFQDIDCFINTILENDKIQTWLLQIKENVKQYQFSNQGLDTTIVNRGANVSELSMEYQNAEYWTTTTTFESFIEEVASIEL